MLVACAQALLFWASETSLARTRERAAKPRGSSAPRSRVVPRLASPAQIGELARRRNVGNGFLELNSKRLYRSSEKGKENRCLVFASPIKREIRKLHVVVVP